MKFKIAILVVALVLMSVGARAFFAGHGMLVSVPQQQGILIFTPTALSFTTTAGTPSAPQTTVAKNTGAVALAISSIGMTGANASDFSQTNNCPATLVVAASCSINVTYSPAAAGSSTASGSVVATPTSVPPTTINSVAMSCGSGCSFTAGSASTLGTASATLSIGPFTGTWSLKTSGTDHAGTACVNYGADFAINSSTGAVTVTSGAPAQSYPGVCLVATQAGLGGSPFAQAFTFTGNVAGAVPGPAAAAGFNTTVINADFTQPFYATQANFVDCAGANTSLATTWFFAWQFSTNPNIPCSAVGAQHTDPLISGPALELSWQDSYDIRNGQHNQTVLQTVNNSGVGNVIPANAYFEATARYDTPATNSQWDIWSYTTVTPGIEYDGIESWTGGTDSSSCRINNETSGGNCNWTGQLPPGFAGGFDYTQYHKWAWRVTSDGSTDQIFCSYVDDVAGGCVSAAPSANQLAGNEPMTMQLLVGESCRGPTPPCFNSRQINMWVKKVRVFSCAGVNSGAKCFSSSANPPSPLP